MSRTVLFIAYDFPPAGGAGVQRSLKFAKYLPHFGWHPVVVTATPDSYLVLDGTLDAGEYSGAALLDLDPNNPNTTTLRLQHNGNRLFFALDAAVDRGVLVRAR